MKTKWVSIDGWRGYYEVIPPPEKEILVDVSVVNDAAEQLCSILLPYLRKNKIHYRAGYTRTSNVFSSHFYIVIDKDRLTPELKEKIAEWFIFWSNSTFSIMTGEQYPLDIEEARKEFEQIIAKQ